MQIRMEMMGEIKVVLPSKETKELYIVLAIAWVSMNRSYCEKPDEVIAAIQAVVIDGNIHDVDSVDFVAAFEEAEIDDSKTND